MCYGWLLPLLMLLAPMAVAACDSDDDVQSDRSDPTEHMVKMMASLQRLSTLIAKDKKGSKTPKSSKSCKGDSNVKKLMTDLFQKAEYDPEVRPVMRNDRNLTVHFGTALHEVEELSENTGHMGYRILLTMWWNDYQLQWDPAEYGGVTKFFLSPQRIWTPDIDLYNSVESKINRNVKLVVYHDGDVLWMPPAHFKSTCSHEFRSDSWHCYMSFRSWSFSGNDLDIKPLEGNANMVTEEVRPSAHYVIIAAEGERELAEYPCCEEPYPTINILLRVRNKIGHPALLGKRSVPDFRNAGFPEF